VTDLSDDEILGRVAEHIRTDTNYRRQLEIAVQTKNDGWVDRLVRLVVGDSAAIRRPVITVITSWFIPSARPEYHGFRESEEIGDGESGTV
jgi:hypothetical protein